MFNNVNFLAGAIQNIASLRRKNFVKRFFCIVMELITNMHAFIQVKVTVSFFKLT